MKYVVYYSHDEAHGYAMLVPMGCRDSDINLLTLTSYSQGYQEVKKKLLDISDNNF